MRAREITWPIAELVIGLTQVNGQLWRAEDDLRARRSVADPNDVGSPVYREAGRIAFHIQALNDERARLIEALNKLTGDHLGTEKI